MGPRSLRQRGAEVTFSVSGVNLGHGETEMYKRLAIVVLLLAMPVSAVGQEAAARPILPDSLLPAALFDGYDPRYGWIFSVADVHQTIALLSIRWRFAPAGEWQEWHHLMRGNPNDFLHPFVMRYSVRIECDAMQIRILLVDGRAIHVEGTRGPVMKIGPPKEGQGGVSIRKGPGA